MCPCEKKTFPRWGSNSQPRHNSQVLSYKYRALTNCATGGGRHVCASTSNLASRNDSIMNILKRHFFVFLFFQVTHFRVSVATSLYMGSGWGTAQKDTVYDAAHIEATPRFASTAWYVKVCVRIPGVRVKRGKNESKRFVVVSALKNQSSKVQL